MEIRCDKCGKVFNKKPSKIVIRNYCSKECRHSDKYEDVVCEVCGKHFERIKCAILGHLFCSRKCAKNYTGQRMSGMNAELNPERMVFETKKKIRESRLNTGEGKSYPKMYGKHEHRIIAERILGRPLMKGEIVHHIDGNKRNNDPMNLMVFSSQAEHALWHKNEKINPSANYE